MKKFISVLLSIVLMFSIGSVAVYAQEAYPYVFVHGMGGWGSYDEYNETVMPYWGGWGGNLDADIVKIFNARGVEAYAASVGPFSSAWDRACELYAQLTGTVVDYGEAHSAAHNHSRYGYSFEDDYLMDEPWDGKSKINLVGHSFGSETVRLFASLVAFGNEEELAATGDETSPLFVGGAGESIHAVISLAGPSNGSPIANIVYDMKVPMMFISAGLNILGTLFGSEVMMWDLKLSHFELTPVQGVDRASLSLSAIKNFYNAEDNCGYDLTLRGAAELNELIELVPEAYYYSYTSIATTTNARDNEMPISTMFTMFKPSSFLLGRLEGKTIDGITLDKNWELNDGIVPLASAMYPLDDGDKAFSYEAAVESGTVEKGNWYYMSPMIGFDHFDFCGTVDYPTSFEDFYFTLVETVNSR